MPWTIKKNHPKCAKSKPWAVVNKSTGRVAGCHTSKTKAQGQIAVLDRVANSLVHSIDRFLLAAGRRNRKPRDLNGLYRTLQAELRRSWNELAEDFRKEWGDPGIVRTFEARRGPSKTQADALYNRASKRANKRQTKAVDDHARKSIKRGGNSAVRDLGTKYGIKFDMKHPEAVKFLRKRGAKQVKNISKTSKERIRNLIVKMVNQGKSHGEIAREIDGTIKGWTKRGVGVYASRGELIAVTEVGEAYEAGRRQVLNEFRKSGIKMEKGWSSVGDKRVCPDICETAEMDGWINDQDQFSNGLDAPLGHPGCRCDMILQPK